MQVKGISWLGVGVEDFEGALAFFDGVLGLERCVVDERGVAILQAADGQLVEIFGPGTTGKALTSPPVAAFEVDDVNSAREELRASGVELIGDVGSWNGFEWAYFRGPGGHVFSIKKTPASDWKNSV